MILGKPFIMNIPHFGDKIGVPMTPEEFMMSAAAQLMRGDCNRPIQLMATVQRSTATEVLTDKEKFQVKLGVQDFGPEDISVKTVDGFLVVEARHEEKPDENGYVTRYFNRRFKIPEACNLDAVSSQLSSDGVLLVTAPYAAPTERIVPIVRTGPMKTTLEEKVEREGDAGESGEGKPEGCQ